MNMTMKTKDEIAQQLTKRNIRFVVMGERIVTPCPSCRVVNEKGQPVPAFILEPEKGDGKCRFCGLTAETQTLMRRLGRNRAISKPEDISLPQEEKLPVEANKGVLEGNKQAVPSIPERKEPPEVFEAMSADRLLGILGITIKRDEENKLIAFLGQLSAYTGNSQLNISFNAPSSTGKSYIPTEIAQLFPKEDVIEIGYVSPTAFFHDVGKYEEAKKGYTVDLERKILIFLDQPHDMLLQHLRPLLSHDKKEIQLKITDKSQKAGIKTKNIFLRGFPSVTFCTAGLKTDEQESTRFILLSPQTDQEKIREAIHEKIRKEADSEAYRSALDGNQDRELLKRRVAAIKAAGVEDVQIGSPEKVERMFFSGDRMLKPRHQRDIGRILALIKGFALFNLWHRDRNGATIVANDEDIEQAFKVWDAISDSQELNLPPYIYQLYKEVILPAWEEKKKSKMEEFATDIMGLGAPEGMEYKPKIGLTRSELTRKHLEVYGRVLPDWLLRQQIAPMLENAGLIEQEADPNDRRKVLICPTTSLYIDEKEERNSESGGGVEI